MKQEQPQPEGQRAALRRVYSAHRGVATHTHANAPFLLRQQKQRARAAVSQPAVRKPAAAHLEEITSPGGAAVHALSSRGGGWPVHVN